MGCDSSKGVVGDGGGGGGGGPVERPAEEDARSSTGENISEVDLSSDKPGPARTPKSFAFEVPFNSEEESNNSLIKKHPPKRLQRLEEQQIPPQLTHRELDEKLAEAEQRRLQILNQRIQSAKARQKLKRSPIFGGESNGLFIESLHREPSTVEL